MKLTCIRVFCLASAAAAALSPTLRAGHEVAPAGTEVKEAKESVEVREWFPDDPHGYITIGSQFSEHLTGFYVDSITGLWAPKERDAFLFLNSRYDWEDNHQYISTMGLGFRKLLPDHDVIIGVNAYWDQLHGAGGSDFDQLGLGAEILTRWIDARVNYYLPDNEDIQVRRHTWRSHDDGGTRTRVYERREAALEGVNAELGFLLPGLCKYTEVRLYGGYYHYVNPFGNDFDGFKARLEARLLPGVIADVEYWNDAALMGGHWTAGVRVSIPFSIANLVNGRNPFEGIGECFTPRERAFSERMGDMVQRSHRVQTVTSGDRLIQDSFERDSSGSGGFSGGGGSTFLPLE